MGPQLLSVRSEKVGFKKMGCASSQKKQKKDNGGGAVQLSEFQGRGRP
jgi:hypothetical protein